MKLIGRKNAGRSFLQRLRERWRRRTDAGYTGPAVHNNREIEKCYGFASYAPLSCQWNRNILLDGDHVFTSVALGRFSLANAFWGKHENLRVYSGAQYYCSDRAASRLCNSDGVRDHFRSYVYSSHQCGNHRFNAKFL
jgi:hypothetical protein